MAESKEHKKLVDAAVAWLNQNGYTILGAHNRKPRFKTPPTIDGSIPDIYARKGQIYVVIEAEHCEEMETLETGMQWKAFRDWADGSPNRRFWLSVPQYCYEQNPPKRLDGADYARSQGIRIDKVLYTDLSA